MVSTIASALGDRGIIGERRKTPHKAKSIAYIGVSHTIRYEERACCMVQIVACCECGGELKATGGVYASDPPRYEHVCDACSCEKTLPYAYPVMEARIIDDGPTMD